jgi:hypothetical protein
MQLLAPDILEEACKLSTPIHATALGVGVLLWALGWTGHRFWIVLIVTIGGGILGHYAGPRYGTQPWLAATLVAFAAGMLALALVRVVAFTAGGVVAIIMLGQLAPGYQERLVVFLVGGAIALVLFRLWTMVLTSAAGTFLMAYSALCLLQRFGGLDVVALAEAQAPLLNIACGAGTFLGLIVQYLVDRRRRYGYDDRYRGWGLPFSRSYGSYGRRGRSYRRAG